MNNHKSAKFYLEDAEIIFQEATLSLGENHFHRVVRKCQEACELAVKSLFKKLGIEYPKSHRLGPLILKELREKGEISTSELDQLRVYADSLALDREVSFYGDEEGTPARDIFDKQDAEDAIKKARWSLDFVQRFVKK